MTFFNSLLEATCAAGNFQAWAQFIDDSLLNGGWVITSDTGQTLPANLVVPTTSQQKRGYRVYQMTDDLSAEDPVTLRLDFGSGFSNFGAPYSPSVWLTLGPMTDGAGNMLNTWLNAAYVESHQGAGGVTNSVASVDKGRCAFGMMCGYPGQGGNTNGGSFAFSIERWKDELGQDIGEGLLLAYTSRQSVQGNVQICLAYSPTCYFEVGLIRQQPIDLGINYIHTTNSPSPTYFGDRGVGVLFHFFGTALQPGKNWVICNSSDTAGPILAVNMYGELIPYVAVNIIPFIGLIGALGFGSSAYGDTFRKVMMRFD
jgi:hypothetical protein